MVYLQRMQGDRVGTLTTAELKAFTLGFLFACLLAWVFGQFMNL
jgi:hypothetical protein